MFQCPLESGDVGCSQSQFTFTFYHEKAVGKLLLQGLYNGGGPVRRTVLDDQNMKGLFQSENGADDVLYVFPFVVGRDDYDAVRCLHIVSKFEDKCNAFPLLTKDSALKLRII